MLRALIIAVGLLVGGGLWYWWTMNSQVSMPSPQESEMEASVNTTSKTEPTAAKPASVQKETQTYRNEEYGFEFEYPVSWPIKTNSFKSPFSKLNLVVNLPGDNNVVLHSFLVNVVTPEFADNAIISRKRLSATTSPMVIGGVNATKFDYSFEGLPTLGADVPFGDYRILIVVDKKHEAEFNQILTSFKFLK